MIKLTNCDVEIDSLTKVIDEKYIIPYPAGISDSEIYDEYKLIFNEREELYTLRSEIVTSYNNPNSYTNSYKNVIDEYNKLIKSLNQAQQEKSPNTRTILDFES